MVVHGPYPESRVARESAAALDAGYEVDIIATRRRGEAAHEVVDGATVTRLPVAHVQGAGMARMLGEYFAFTALAAGVVGARAISRRYDVVHVHAPPDFLIVSALIPRLFGSRVILDIHDRSPDMFSMRFPGRLGVLARASLERLERLAARCADVVVTVHDPYVRELVALGIPAEKTIVVMNSLDERLLPSPKPPLHEPFRIVYHGTLTPHYGVDLLVEAAAQIVERGLDARVEIIGEGDSLPKLQSPGRRPRSLRPSRDRWALPAAPNRARADQRRVCRRGSKPADTSQPVRALVQALRVRRPRRAGCLGGATDTAGVLLGSRGSLLRTGQRRVTRRRPARGEPGSPRGIAASRAGTPSLRELPLGRQSPEVRRHPRSPFVRQRLCAASCTSPVKSAYVMGGP